MYPEEQKLHDIEMKVGLLSKDIEQTDRICEKLSESIEKIQEVNANILRMITLHEQRHEQHEKVETELKEDIKDLHSRITTVSREIHTRIDEVEDKISAKLDTIRSELAMHVKNDPNKLTTVLAEIDKYKFAIVAVAVSIGWIIGHIDLNTLGKLLK